MQISLSLDPVSKLVTILSARQTGNQSAGPSNREPEPQPNERANWQQTFATPEPSREPAKHQEAGTHRDPLVPQERPSKPHFYMDDDGEDERMSEEEDDEFVVPATPPEERGAY